MKTPSERGERAELLGLLARGAQDGDRRALDQLVTAVRDDVYRLALRMTGTPPDADDATQEILVKVVTRLSSWRGEARITTWVHRVAVNHLLDRRRSALERASLSFEQFGADLLDGLSVPDGPLDAVLVEEVRLGCTLAMLACLDRPHRVAYLLGEVFDLPGEDAAWICEVSHETFRKRLSRARSKVQDFMRSYCGLVEDRAPCRCERRVERAVTLGRIDPTRRSLSGHPTSSLGELRALAARVDERRGVALVMRDHPDYATTTSLADLSRLLDGLGDLTDP